MKRLSSGAVLMISSTSLHGTQVFLVGIGMISATGRPRTVTRKRSPRATAAVQGVPVFTRDANFAKIPGVKVVLLR